MLCPLQGNGWADLPSEVIEEVLDKLCAKDVWNSRQISSNWGIVVRDYQCGVVVPVDTRTIWSQSTSFRQRQKQYPLTRFTLRLANPLCFAACAELLTATAAKVTQNPLFVVLRFVACTADQLSSL